MAGMVIAINAAPGIPQVGGVAIGNDAAPNPGSFSPTFGAGETLWLWLAGIVGSPTMPPAGAPTNYTAINTQFESITGIALAAASRALNAATEDPPSWAISAAGIWTAMTVAVGPVIPAPSIVIPASLVVAPALALQWRPPVPKTPHLLSAGLSLAPSLGLNYTARQLLVPDADIAASGWTTAPLFSKVDEKGPSDDGDFITATAAPS